MFLTSCTNLVLPKCYALEMLPRPTHTYPCQLCLLPSQPSTLQASHLCLDTSTNFTNIFCMSGEEASQVLLFVFSSSCSIFLYHEGPYVPVLHIAFVGSTLLLLSLTWGSCHNIKFFILVGKCQCFVCQQLVRLKNLFFKC